MSYVIMDVETTGQEEGDVIQVAILNPGGEHFMSKCRPSKKVMPAATVVHGVSDDRAQEFPPADEVKDALQRYTDALPSDTVFIGHNLKFDIEHVSRCFGLVPQLRLCTLRMARKLIPVDLIGNHKLDTVFYFTHQHKLDELMESRASHDAMRDCQITETVYLALRQIALERGEIPSTATPREVAVWADKPMLLTVWPMGKHKGKPLNIDWGYAEWYLRQKDLDPDLEWSLREIVPT